MIAQNSLDIQLENLLAFIRLAGLPIAPIHNADTLSEYYRQALEIQQNRVSRGQYQKINMVINHHEAIEFCKLLSDDELSLLDDKNQASVINREYDPLAQEKADLIKSAVQCLGLLSPDHKNLLDLLITDVFIMPSNEARGGSTSSAIGVIWANPKITYRLPDIVEFIVHELTHHTLFIDEYHYGHYNYSLINDQKYWAQSALLKVPRPLDKVIHSMIVATEIVLFRERFLGHPATPSVHPPTPKILGQLAESFLSVQDTIDCVEKQGNSLISPRVKALLSQAKNSLLCIPSFELPTNLSAAI